MFRRKMSDQKSKLILIAGLFVFLWGGLVVGQEFALDCQPKGNITYQGNPVPPGYTVTAYIGLTKVGESSQTKIGGQYELRIPPDDPATSEKDGWSPGDMITIKVGSVFADPPFPVFSGSK